MGPVIDITPLQATILRTYLKTGSKEATAKALVGVTYITVRDNLARLEVMGIMASRPDRRNGLIYTGAKYRVTQGDAPHVVLPKKKSLIVMSDSERQWMKKEYSKYQDQRREAAKILGRTIVEVNLMAMELKLDRKSL